MSLHKINTVLKLKKKSPVSCLSVICCTHSLYIPSLSCGHRNFNDGNNYILTAIPYHREYSCAVLCFWFYSKGFWKCYYSDYRCIGWMVCPSMHIYKSILSPWPGLSMRLWEWGHTCSAWQGDKRCCFKLGRPSFLGASVYPPLKYNRGLWRLERQGQRLPSVWYFERRSN